MVDKDKFLVQDFGSAVNTDGAEDLVVGIDMASSEERTCFGRSPVTEAAKWLMYKRLADELAGLSNRYMFGHSPDDVKPKECPDCDGRGKIELFTSWAECDECGGTGRV